MIIVVATQYVCVTTYLNSNLPELRNFVARIWCNLVRIVISHTVISSLI